MQAGEGKGKRGKERGEREGGKREKGKRSKEEEGEEKEEGKEKQSMLEKRKTTADKFLPPSRTVLFYHLMALQLEQSLTLISK